MPTEQLVLEARQGIAVSLAAGEQLRIVNTHGGQVVDTWALNASDPSEHLSMPHTRAALLKLVPRLGDNLFSSLRRPLLTLVEDTSPGVHDTLIAACDPERYRQLGAEDGHASCAQNFKDALARRGLRVEAVPAPLNLFMRIPWRADGALEFLPSPARPGDYVTLAAAIDAIVVLSACPQDIAAVNANAPADIGLELHRA